ncbi:MAG TPA: hypothetical protein PK890_09715, partial [Terrimesophilobacter sp.]|nr:hypothetical protein [Terrimesophilobacter sp.]
MRDPLDDSLADAGKHLRDAPNLDAALVALATARADEALPTAKPARKRRAKLTPVIAVGAVLAVASAGAVAANQWGPWNYVSEVDTDIVVEREWSDVDGNYLGACEARLSTDVLPTEARKLALDYLATVDVDAIEPDPEYVAGVLNALGRVDDIGALVAGAVPSDFDNSPGGTWTGPAAEYFSDARVLHQALTQAVFVGMAAKIREQIEF